MNRHLVQLISLSLLALATCTPPAPPAPRSDSMTFALAVTGGAKPAMSTAAPAHYLARFASQDQPLDTGSDASTVSRLAKSPLSGGGITEAFAPLPVPTLEQFVQTVRTGQAGSLTGVFVENTMALVVLPADPNNPINVTIRPGAVTHSCGSSDCPSVGLLAHNLLAGALFSRLFFNQEVDLIYGDGSIERYRIGGTRRFQALSPQDPYSSFVDVESPDRVLSSTDVFVQTFGVPHRVVLQTCITANGNLTWGRLFVIAEPL